MMYIFAAIAISAFLTGFGVSHQIDKAEIQHMSDGIAAQNLEAKLTLQILTEQADNAKKQLEAANDSAIKAINSQRDDFKSKRMYDTHRKSSSCASSNTPSTANPAPDDGELSAEYTAFLKSEAYRADEISAYATLCKNYINTLRELDYVKLE